MRRINLTNVIVHVNGRIDRTNVVATLTGDLRRLRLFLRGACKWLARQYAQASKHLQARYAAVMRSAAVSPSWGGHRPSGGPGSAISG